MTDQTKPKPFCFVLMPFDTAFDDVYKLGIKDACKETGAYCERVDEQVFQERILDRIYNQIAKADIVIADMTGRNPNVFYEVGYAHALGKTTILVTELAEDIPFDLKHYPHIIYNNSIADLKENLKRRIETYLQNPTHRTEEKLAIEVYIGRHNLSSSELNLGTNENEPCLVELTFCNNSPLTFEAGDFRAGIISSTSLYAVSKDSNRHLKCMRLPDGSYMWALPHFETLFPSEFTSISLSFYFRRAIEKEEVVLRLFTDAGTRDFKFGVQVKHKPVVPPVII